MTELRYRIRPEAVRAWWRAIHQKQREEGDIRFYFDRGHRARLRRCATLEQIAQESSTWDLASALSLAQGIGSRRQNEQEESAVLLMAGLLAHVAEDDTRERSIIGHLGNAFIGKDEKPRLSELRFQRTMRSVDENDFFKQMRRALLIGDGTANVAVLAQDLLDWSRERDSVGPHGGRMKFRWARDYYLKRSDLDALQAAEPDAESATA